MLAPAMVLAVSATVASCVSPSSPPRRVEATAPSVTYKYRGDRELVNATRRAEDYCSRYGAAPRMLNVTDDPDGSSTVVFSCDRTTSATAVAPAPAPVPRRPSVSYTYRTDSQLVDATGTAAAYCRNYNGRPEIATVTSNGDGSKTVVFDCGP
jgi:hypothetical protein